MSWAYLPLLFSSPYTALGRVGSNHDSQSQSLMSYRWTTPQASSRIRTGDLLITNQVLYQLSYIGTAKTVGSRALRLADGRPILPADTPSRATCVRTNAPGSKIET